MEKFAARVAALVVQRPWSIVLLASVVFVFFAIQVPRVVIDNSVDNMLPVDDPVVLAGNRSDAEFGSGSSILVAIRSTNVLAPAFLQKLAGLTHTLDRLDAKILADKRPEMIREVSRIIGLSGDDGKKAAGYFESIPTDNFADFSRAMTLEAIQESGLVDDAAALKIAERFSGMSGLQKTNLHTLLVPGFVKEAISLANADYVEGEGDTFRVEKLPGEWERPEEIGARQARLVKTRLARWDLYDRFLVNDDHTVASILVRLRSFKQSVSETALEYVKKEVTAAGFADADVFIAGEPVVTTLLGKFMVRDLEILFPFVLIVVLTSLVVSFRRLGATILPLIGVLYATVITIGLMAMTGSSITVISVVLPVLMIAVGSAYAIHVVNAYLLHGGSDMHKAVRESVTETFVPVLMAAFTTVGGFASLASNSIIPIRDFGIFTAIGVLAAFILAVLFVPALAILMRMKPMQETHEESADGKILGMLSGVSKRHVWPVFTVGVLFVVISGIFAGSIRVDTNAVRMFQSDTEIRKADAFINTHFKGTSTAEILIHTDTENGAFEPKLLRIVDGLEDWLMTNAAVPAEVRSNFGGALHLADYIKKANRSLHGEKKDWYRIPDSRRAVMDYMLILRGATDDLVSRDGKTLRVVVTMKDGSTVLAGELKGSIGKYMAANNLPDFEFLGVMAKYLQVDRLIVLGQIVSILLSIIAVFLLNAVVFRSIFWAAVSLVPLSMAIAVNFGIMGAFGLLLDVGTSMIASIAIGIGVDYSIHFINGMLVRVRRGMSLDEAMHRTGMQTGRAILFNMVAVMAGFFVLAFSSFVPLINFGILIGITMITTGLASLLVLPAFIRILAKTACFTKVSGISAGSSRGTSSGLKAAKTPAVDSSRPERKTARSAGAGSSTKKSASRMTRMATRGNEVVPQKKAKTAPAPKKKAVPRGKPKTDG